MNKTLLLSLLLALASGISSRASISAAGDLMFTGFNADGNDDLAFVFLNSYAANTPIFFSDNEWSGSEWINSDETFFQWSSPVDLAAGTVITLGSLSTGTIVPTAGSAASFTSVGSSGPGLAASNEAVYAYVGASADTATPVFLSAIANSGFVSDPTGYLDNTGLTPGSTATVFTNGHDIFAYTGDRSSQASWAAYKNLIGSTGNWISQDGSGDQSIDGTAPNVPFSSAPFSLAAVPEPGAPLLVTAGILAMLTLRRRP